MPKVIVVFLFLASIALASNPNDEQTVRTAYAKLAYAVQTKIIVTEATANPDLSTAELAKKLQENGLRFEITDMSSGNISEIESRPYWDLVTKPNQQKILSIPHETYSLAEFNKVVAVSLVATPSWTTNENQYEVWDMSVKEILSYSNEARKYSRYVAATMTVRFQHLSRTYHALWLFSDSDVMCADTVAGSVVADFVKESTFPSVLTDTHLRYRAAVDQWLNSTQRFEASCRAGKIDVCCDSTMQCGVLPEDLRTKPAPNALTPKETQQSEQELYKTRD